MNKEIAIGIDVNGTVLYRYVFATDTDFLTVGSTESVLRCIVAPKTPIFTCSLTGFKTLGDVDKFLFSMAEQQWTAIK